MTQTVSISDARANLAEYIALSRKGMRIVIKDEKKNEELAEIVTKNAYNSEVFKRALNYISAHPISKNDHPEWSSRKKVDLWLRKTRSSWNRYTT